MLPVLDTAYRVIAAMVLDFASRKARVQSSCWFDPCKCKAGCIFISLIEFNSLTSLNRLGLVFTDEVLQSRGTGYEWVRFPR